MPAARGEASEDRVLRGVLVEVEGLRIELGRERFDLRGVERVRRAFKALPDVEIVGEASDGAQTLQMLAALEPDIAFVDISMPGISGI